MFSHLALTLAVTDIGDTASLLAISVASLVYLKSRGAGRASIFLLVSQLMAGILIGLLKLLFFTCHEHFHMFSIHSPSGHTAQSAAVLWSLAMLMRSQLEPARKFLPLLLLTLLITAIGATRITLGAHTCAEVILGGLTGLTAFALTYFFLLRRHGTGSFDAYALALWAVVAAVAIHGVRLPAEDWVHSIAVHLRGNIPFCG